MEIPNFLVLKRESEEARKLNDKGEVSSPFFNFRTSALFTPEA